MIHLGYLGYNETRKTAFVPNEEIRQELTTAVERKTWNEMLVFQQESENLLDATLDLNGSEVAKQIEKIHNEYVSVIQYHNENSLSSVLAIAYLSAMQYYFKPIRELPTGRGFADFVFIPKPEYKDDYPALIVELKCKDIPVQEDVGTYQVHSDLKYYFPNYIQTVINKIKKYDSCM